MKVILLRDVARIGKRGEVKDVPAGHALNFLIPRKHALPASEDNLRRAKEVEKHTATKTAHHDANFKGALLTLATTVVEIPASANAQGHLFKGLHAADIAKRFNELDIPVTESEIELKQAIKEVGEHTITLRAHDQHGTCVVRVIPQ